MLPDPLHPAIVHFPVVLSLLLPAFAIGAVIMIRRGARPRPAWSLPAVFAVALALSSWAAVETGETQEERVERVVADQPLSTHADMAETFLSASAVLMLVAIAGLAPGRAGRIGRGLATAGSIAMVVGAARVGHTGGELVYRHGAASAYASPATPIPAEGMDQGGGDHDR